MCIPGIIFQYEHEMEVMESQKKEEEVNEEVKPNICAYSGLPSPLHYSTDLDN